MNILNDRQYRVAKTAAERFAHTLADYERALASPGTIDMHPIAIESMRGSLQSQIQALHGDIAEYEIVRDSRYVALPLRSLDDLPDVLIKSRISAPMTQKALAKELDVAEQQVQRWEQTRYKGVSWERMKAVLSVLQMQFQGSAQRSATPLSAGD